MNSFRRALLCSSAAIAVLGLGLAVAQAPAAAANAATLNPTTWAYVDSQAPRTSFANRTGNAPVGSRVEADTKTHTYRSYFRFDLSALTGQVVHFANLYTSEASVTDCHAAAPIELWRTRPLKSTATWRDQPAEIELLQRYNRGAGAACPGYIGKDLVAALNAALARHETSVTVELRIAQSAESDAALGRTVAVPAIALTSNHVPTVKAIGLVGPDRPCGTPTTHPIASNYTTFKTTVTDADVNDHPSVTFAIWPIDHPDQRQQFGGVSGASGTATYWKDLSGYAEGTVLAWAAQASDQGDTSDWSNTCYLTVDPTGPTTAPAVSSKLYPEGWVAGGGPGVKGKFRFDALGDRSTVAFEWTDLGGYPRTVQARRPGGSAVIEYTPTWYGMDWLDVVPLDAAGNRGPSTHYQFSVRDTAPWGQVDMAGIGLPSKITLSSSAPKVSDFSYQLPGAAEVKFKATKGTGTTTITFTEAGYVDIVVRTYAGGKMIGSNTLQVSVTDEPVVESAEFTWEHDAAAGMVGTFTLRPRTTGVVAYVYDLGEGEQRVTAAADGTAVVTWTATAGWHDMTAWSERADGSRSQPTTYSFLVNDTRPSVYSSELVSWPRTDGVGQPLQFQFDNYVGGLTGFAYSFNGGPEQTVSTNGNTYALVTFTPEHAGDNSLVVRSLFADGTQSPELAYPFQIWSGPVVTWQPAGDGTVDHPATFTFHPGLPNVKEYRYSLPIGDEQTITAGADGTATMVYTPQFWGLNTIYVTSVSEDGTASDTRQVYFSVRDNRVSVYSGYGSWGAGGGIGTTGLFSFYTQLSGEVVEYRYHVNDEPEQTLAASTEGTSTYASITFNRNGLNTLYVQSVTSTGELSPVTEYPFLVGTAPLVVSAEYPNSQWGGGIGVEGTFEFSGGTAGIVSFDYQWDYGTTATVATDADGRASITYTPTGTDSFHTLVVTGRLADGSATDSTTYQIYVAP